MPKCTSAWIFSCKFATYLISENGNKLSAKIQVYCLTQVASIKKCIVQLQIDIYMLTSDDTFILIV